MNHIASHNLDYIVTNDDSNKSYFYIFDCNLLYCFTAELFKPAWSHKTMRDKTIIQLIKIKRNTLVVESENIFDHQGWVQDLPSSL